MKSKHAGVYCSRPCHYAGRSRGLTSREVTRPYTYTPESKAALIAASRKPKGKRTKRMITCCHCGTVKHDPSYGRKRLSGLAFCSLACCNAYRVGENNPAWRGGYVGYYGPSWRPARRAARERDSHQCRRCGRKLGRRPDVHHIQPFNTFASHEEANRVENLVSLCHSCHMYVEWRGIDFPL
jgi:hypothetical protein